jgi:hypothetical protein
VFVQNTFIGDSSNIPGALQGTPATSLQETPQPGELQAVVGFNTPYAAHLHEHPEYNFKEEGAGGKYIESKINTFKEDYVAVVAESIKEGFSE